MDFRQWCYEKWCDHCAEFEAWFRCVPNYPSREYFHKYKWWLRRQYRAEMHSRPLDNTD